MTREEFLQTFQALVRNYKPAPDVLERLRKITLLMVIGPSGVGKTTVIHSLGLPFVPSDTTRDPRPGEKDGIDMYFRKDYDKLVEDIKAGRLVQIAPFATGDLYATKDTSYPESGPAVMPVMVDAVPVFRNLGFQQTISAFITPPSYEEWMRRLSNHHAGNLDLSKRLSEAKRSFSFALSDPQMHFIDTESLEAGVRQTKDLLTGKIDETAEQKARQAAHTILNRLN